VQGTSNASPSNAHLLLNPISAGAPFGTVLIGAGTAEVINTSDLLHVRGPDTANASITVDSYGSPVLSALRLGAARGTFAAPTVNLAGDTLGQVLFRGWQGGVFQSASAFVSAVVGSNNFSASDHGTNVQITTTPTGTTSTAFMFGTGAVKPVSNNSLTSIANLNVAPNAAGGVIFFITIQVTNGTDTQTAVGQYFVGGVNKAGAYTLINTGTGLLTLVDANAAANKALSSGTLTVTVQVATASPVIGLQINVNSSLTSITRETVSYTYANMSDGSMNVL
jgi:hypothetical protein